MSSTSERGLVELIGNIYDAVIERRLWGNALELLRQRFEFQLAVLSAHGVPRGNPIIQAVANVQGEYLVRLAEFGSEAMDVWGGAARLASFPLEEPVLTSHVTDQSYWETLRFYREWVRPQGIVDQVGVILVRDQTMMSALGLSVHRSRQPITEVEFSQLRMLAPHLSRAVTISGLLDTAVAAAATFQAALEATSAGVVLVDPNMTIIHANRAAAGMLEAGDPVSDVSGRLALRDEFVPGQLLSAVRAASKDEAGLGRRGIGITARLRNGNPVSINVMPLERRSIETYAGNVATAAVFVSGAAAPLQLPADAMRLLYDLTPAEQRVFELVVEGRRTEDVSEALGVAPSTVRTHLLSVFNKTDRRSRAELMTLAREIRLPT